jgi:23S rRNA pseudouridine2604 synthase
MKKELVYPARINKYLAHKNFCTRREADSLVAEKRVKINERLAVLGDKVSKNDRVTVDKKNRKKKIPVYLAFNKPRGILTHSSQQKGEKGIAEILRFHTKVFPVGRLDKDSSGLIILTNDGRVTDRVLSPDYYHEKEYVVTVDRSIGPSFIRRMSGGLKLDDDGYVTRKCQVEKIDNLTFSIVITEGKKRQIRRMCEKLEHTVKSLKRVRVMNVRLGDLSPGGYRLIEGEELQEFLRALRLEGAEWL